MATTEPKADAGTPRRPPVGGVVAAPTDDLEGRLRQIVADIGKLTPEQKADLAEHLRKEMALTRGRGD